MMFSHILPLHDFCIYYKKSSVCNSCINRSNFKPSCEYCIMWIIPIPKLCYECMMIRGGNRQYFEEVL